MSGNPVPFLVVYGGGDQGGGAEYLATLLRVLDRSRFAPTYVSLGRDDLASRLGDGVPCRRSRGVRELAALVRETGARFVHTHGVRANLIGRLAGRATRRPVLTTVHSLIAYDYDSSVRRTVAVGVDNLSLSLSDHFIAVSESVAADLIRRGVPRRKIHVVYNGVAEPSRLPEPAAARRDLGLAPGPTVGTVARLHAVKGVRYLLQAAAILQRRGVACQVVVVGDGPERGALEREGRELGLAPPARFLGFRERPVELLPALDVFVLPSLMEGMGLAVLEAMLAGLPVVASRVGGVRELVAEGETGLLVPPADPQSLADALMRLLGDPDLARRLGEAGRERYRRDFALESFARGTEAVYDAVLEEGE